MIHDLKPYPVMKDSGVPWLGEVPAHWEVRRIKTLFREQDERNGNGSGILLSLTRVKGIVPQAEASNRIASTEDLSKYKICRPGDLVMNRMQAWSGMFALSTYEGVISPDYSIFCAIDRSDVKFFEHLFKTPIVVAQFAERSKGIGSGFNRLYTPDFGAVPVVVPPLPEQAAIVRFLDYMDRRLRRYIRAKQKLIKLMEEQKQAIIHRAVTRGLDPNVRLKPSGVEWLGEVPEHWEVRRLKTLCSMRSGDGITAMSIETAGDYPVYGGNGMRGYTSNYTHDGDFALIGRQGALCGNVHLAHGRFWASEHAVVASLRPGHVLDWFGSILMVMNLNQYSIAAAQPGLAVERVRNLLLPVPPAPEQALIAKHIEHETTDITQAVNRTNREIALFREYRTRLIADVVTGKLDVREAAARLPEEAEAPEALEKIEAGENGEEMMGEGEGASELQEAEA
ncbi:MAG: restriction endonuclease subunit S [Proteobacteria bacterium]|nr:restriction endonuclease subunit S [Pseudomonadota bacterium]